MQLEILLEERTRVASIGGGLHLMGEWYGCVVAHLLLESLVHVREACIAAVNEANLTMVGERFHALDDGGVTGVILLAESHLAIRTWPEQTTVALDVFVCNHTGDNREKARALFAALRSRYRPERENLLQVRRGGAAV